MIHLLDQFFENKENPQCNYSRKKIIFILKISAGGYSSISQNCYGEKIFMFGKNAGVNNYNISQVIPCNCTGQSS